MNIKNLTIKKFHKGLLNGDFSTMDAAQAYFERIEEVDESINAYLGLLKDDVYQSAEKVDLMLDKGGELPSLAGVPFAIKDNILIKDHTATAASRILEKYTASYDATAVKKLRRINALFLGKANMDEFAMGSSTENSAFQLTRNPLDPNRVPGGSSGGSAAAIASGQALAALGSDTGGSVRQPAAFCGVVGLKPSYGAVSRHGLIAMASSLDQIGPLGKTVEDVKIIFDAIRGKDKYDSTSTNINLSDGFASLDDMKKLTVGLPKEYFVDGLDAGVKEGVERAIETLKSLGLEFKEVSLSHTDYALAVYYIIMPAEVSANLARFDGIRYSRIVDDFEDLSDLYFQQRGEGFGEEVKRRVLLGAFVLSAGYYDAYYNKAQKVRRLIVNDFKSVFEEVDVLLTPTTPTPPFKIGEKTDDPLSMYLSDIFTVPANLAGIPAMSLPVRGFETRDGLPVGFQLMSGFGKEDNIFNVGYHYERAHEVY